MSKRSRRLGKKNELRAVEDAIGASLGKNAAADREKPPERHGRSRKTDRKLSAEVKRD